MSQGSKIFGVTILLMGVTFLSKIIGFLREMFIAAEFGASQQADIFVAVSAIPTLLLTITGGALSAALVPLIIRLRANDETVRLKQLLSSMFSLTSLIMLGLTALLYIFIQPFTDLYVVGFDDNAKRATAELFKILLPAIFTVGLISLFSATLNAYHHFLTPSLGPIFYSTGVIIATVFFGDDFGVTSLIIGMVIGIIFQFFLLLFVIFKKGIRFSLRIKINEDVKKVGFLILPIFISVGAFQINVLVDKMMGSTLPEGTLAALNYANRVIQLPIALFVGPMVLPLFPAIADKIANKDFSGTRSLLSGTYRLLGILLLPVVGVYIALAEPIIAAIFQRGEFDAAATEITGLALIFYSFMILPFAMRDVMTRAFYALQDTWTPVINSVLLVSLNVILMLIFVPKLGLIAVAGSTSISSFFGYWRLRHKLNKRIGKESTKEERKIWLLIWRNAIIFTVLAWAIYELLLIPFNNPTGLELWLRITLSFAVSGLVYLYLTLKIDTDEVKWLKTKTSAITKRFLKRNNP